MSNELSPFGANTPRHLLPGYRSEGWPKEESYSYLLGKQKEHPHAYGIRTQMLGLSGRNAEGRCGGAKVKAVGFHAVTHNGLAPHFWTGQIVPILAEPPLFCPFRVVRLDGAEFVCRVEERNGYLFLHLLDDETPKGTLIVHPGKEGFEVLGAALSTKASEAGEGARAQMFWPAFNSTAN